jgi:hypothetical protein
MKNVYYVLIAIVIAGAAFYGGMQFSQSQASAGGNNAQRQRQFGNGNINGRFGVGRGGPGGNLTNGEIMSKDAQSITIKMRDGSSKIVFYSPSTRVGKTTDATSDDLKEGTTVMVTGTSNTDGSVTAQSIQLGNPFVNLGGNSNGNNNGAGR